MSQLMRMTYGHGGTKLERIMVSASHQESAAPPIWLRLLLLAMWIVVPLLVCLYAVPKSSRQEKTIIDISRLTIKPPPVLEKPILPKPKLTLPIEKPVEPTPKTEAIREPEVKKPLEQQTIAPPPVEMKRPPISRSPAANLPDVSEPQLRVARERSRVETGIEAVSKERIRREATAHEAPSERTAITRSRGATAMDSSLAKDRIAILRRTALTGDLPSAGGNGIPQRPIQRSQRSAGLVGPVDGGGQRDVASRKRSKVSGGGADGESTSTLGLVRGLSLMSLEICSSPQKQEEAIKSVLSVVGSRQSCSDDKGEFQFKGTQRISSFNLMIFPSKGRRPSNRCEELDNAYKCLKTY
jgi:hypothetical protein